MTDQQRLFHDLFCSGHFPEISDEVIHCIEGFLAFNASADSTVQLNCLIDFYSTKFWQFQQDLNGLTDNSKQLLLRLLHTLRFLRPSQLTDEISQQLESIAFTYLKMQENNLNNSIINKEAFIILIDHFIAHPHGKENRINELIDFILNFLTICSNPISIQTADNDSNDQNLCTVDHQILFIIIYSYRYLLSVCDKSIFQTVLPKSINLLMKISLNALFMQGNSNFFPDFELIASKTLRLAAHLTEWLKKFSKETLDLLIEIQKNIPDDVRFMHINFNFMLFACTVFELNDISTKQPPAPNSSPSTSSTTSKQAPRPNIKPNLNSNLQDTPIQKVFDDITKIIPFFIFPPFNKSRRATIFFHTFKDWVTRKIQTTQYNHSFVFPKIFPIFGHLQGHLQFLKDSYEIFSYFIKPDLFLSKPGLQLDLLEQFITCLEMIRDEFDSYDFSKIGNNRPFEVDYYLETNIIIFRLIVLLFSVKDITDVSKFAYAELFGRIFKYIDYFLDIAGKYGYSKCEGEPLVNYFRQQIILPRFKDKVANSFIHTVLSLFSKMPIHLYNYVIPTYLYSLIPKKPHHSYHITLIHWVTNIIVNQKSKQDVHSPSVFFNSFFTCIVNNFNELFLPKPNYCILITVQQIFNEAFIKSNDSQLSSHICVLLYNFMNLAISSREKSMIEFIFHLFQQIKTPIAQIDPQQQQKIQIQNLANINVNKLQQKPTTNSDSNSTKTNKQQQQQQQQQPNNSSNKTININPASLIQNGIQIKTKTQTPLSPANKEHKPTFSNQNQSSNSTTIKLNPNQSSGIAQNLNILMLNSSSQSTPIYKRPLKLEPFFNILKNNIFPYHQILKTLEDDPKLELCTSVLSIYIFPYLTIPTEYIDIWITLFLPALESETYRPKIIQPVLEIFSDNLPNWIIIVNERTQYRLLKAFSKEKTFVNLLLSKIPYASSLISMMMSPSSKYIYDNDPDSILVTYEEEEEQNEEEEKSETSYLEKIMSLHEKKLRKTIRIQELPYDSLLNGFDTLSKPTQQQLEALIKCFICFISKLNFTDSVSCHLVIQTYELYAKHNKTEIINDSYKLTKKFPTKYSLLFLREHLGQLSIEKIVTDREIIPNPSDFINYVTLLCYRGYTSPTAIKIIGYLLPFVPNDVVYVRAVSSLLHASMFEPKLVKEIYKEHFFSRQFNLETDEKSLKTMQNLFFTASLISIKNIHILAMKALDYVLKATNSPTDWIDERAKHVISNKLLELKPNDSCIRYQFIFSRSSIEPVEPTLLSKIVEKFWSIDFPNISPETQKLLKALAFSDKSLFPFETKKFLLKVICRLLANTKQADHIWDKLFFILSEDKFKSILPYFYKRIKKEAVNGFPSIIPIPHFIKLYSKQVSVSPSTSSNTSSNSNSSHNVNFNQNTASNPNLKSLTTPQINVNLHHPLTAATASATSPIPSPSLNSVSSLLFQNSQIGVHSNPSNSENNSSSTQPSSSTQTPPSSSKTAVQSSSTSQSSANQTSPSLAGIVSQSGSSNFINQAALVAAFHNQQAQAQAHKQNVMINQQQSSSSIPSPDDIKFLYIIIRYSAKPPIHQFPSYVNWLCFVLNSYQSNFRNSPRDTIQKGITEILRVIRRIKRIDQRADMSSLYKHLFDFLIFTRQYLLHINVPIYKMAIADPNLTVRVILAMIKDKKWNPDLFLIGCHLFCHKKCSIFRNGMVILVTENIKSISRYLTDNASIDLDFIINKVLNCISDCFTKLDPTDFNIFQMLKLAKSLFLEIMKTRNEFKPIYLYHFTHIFFPVRFTSAIESTHDLFPFYKTKILIIFMATPKLFFHPLFIRKFIQFMKALSIQSRLDIWMNTLPKLKTDDKFSDILNNHLKNELFKAFPSVDKEEPESDDENNENENKENENKTEDDQQKKKKRKKKKKFNENEPRREIMVGFSEYQKCDAFFSYMLNFTGAMLAYSNPNILIPDLNENPISDICPQVHALFIREGLSDASSIRTVQRLSTIARSLTLFEGDDDSEEEEEKEDKKTDNCFHINFDDILIHLLSINPFMSKQTILCFKMFAQPDFVIKKPSKLLMQYLLSFSSIMIENTHKEPDRQLFTYIPIVFKNLHKSKIGCDRILDILLFTTNLVMKKIDSIIAAQYIPSTIELYVPLINPNIVNKNLLNHLKDKLRECSNPKSSNQQNSNENKTEQSSTSTPNPQQQAANQSALMKQIQVKVKFIFQLIPALAPLLFSPKLYTSIPEVESLPEFLPPDILPSNFFTYPFVKDLLVQYQTAVQKSVQEGGYKIAKSIIDDTYKMFKNHPLSEPLKTPFATAAEWIKEYKGGESNLYFMTNILIEVMKPKTLEKLIIELYNIKQPVHPVILNSINTLVNDSFPEFASAFRKFPKLFILTTKYISKRKPIGSPKDDDSDLLELMNQSFKINWHLIDQSTHLSLFSRLVFPDVFHSVLRHFNEKEMQRVVSISIINQPPEFSKFIQYYVHFFPNSSLSVSFTLHSSFSHSVPFPYSSLYKNMSCLEQSNNWNDSLGLLQQTFPRLLSATSFHELGNYTSARHNYLMSMIPKNFMDGIDFFKDTFYYNREDLFDNTIEDNITQFEHSNRPEDFYFHALLKLRNCCINETLSSVSNMRDVVLKTRNSMPIVTLPLFQDNSPFLKFDSPQEKNNQASLATSFISPSYIPMFFKTSLYEEIHIYLKVYMDQMINFDEFIRMSSLIWVNSLDRLTAMASNFTWRYSILEDFAQNGSNFEKNPMISGSTMKIQEIIKSNHEKNARLLAQSDCIRYALKQMEKAECYVSKDILKITSRNLPRISHFLKKHPKFISLKSDTLIMLRDFEHAIQTNLIIDKQNIQRRQLLRIYLSMVLHYPECINKQSTLNYLFIELVNAEPIDRYLVLSLICKLIKTDENLKTNFTTFLPQLKEEQYDLFLEWLPPLFKTCGHLPISFMVALMEFSFLHNKIAYFLLQLHHLKNSHFINDKGYFAELSNAMKKRREAIYEFESSLEFTKATENDISSMFTAIRAIRDFYIGLIKGRSKIKFSEDLAEYFTNFEELTEYVANHPPVFQTKITMTDYISLIGFRFPNTSQNVLRIKIESGDQNEAHIKYMNKKGETKSFLLLPLHIYRFTYNEYILTNILNKMVMYKNECSALIYYPQAFLIHPMLLLVNAPESSNMTYICKPYSLPKYLYCFKDTTQDHQSSPQEVIDRRAPDLIPKDLLFKWFIKGSKGIKNDFLFLRRSFAIYFGSISYLHCLFGSPQMFTPPLLFVNDRQRVCFSGFIDKTVSHATIAMTPQIETLIPEFVFRGSFAASWHTVADTALRYKEALSIILSAILPDSSENDMIETLIEKMEKFGNQIGEDTDKSDEYFPFLCLDHLIRTSKNSMIVQPTKFGWM